MTKDLIDPRDLEERLRRDLPRLAGAFVDAHGPAPSKVPTPLTRVADTPAGSMPTYTDNVASVHDSHRRHRLLIAAAIVLVFVIGAAVALTTRNSSSPNSIATLPEPALPGAQPGTWTDIAPAPFEGAMDAAAVWTGSEVLLFGGHRSIDGVMNAELISAAYNPTTATWRELAEPPGMTPVVAATWAGDVAVVVGKNSGAVYDPASDSWRELPSMFTDDVAGSSQLAQPVWTGDQLLLISVRYGDDGSGVQLNAQGFDLEHWDWIQPSSGYLASGLPLADSTDGPPATTWDGGVAVVDLPVKIGPWASSWAFDPATDRWTGVSDPATTDPNLPANYATITAVGGKTYRVVNSGGNDQSTVSVWVREESQWTKISDLPATIQPYSGFQAVATGAEIVIVGLTGKGDQSPLEFDLATNTWHQPIPGGGPGWWGRTVTAAGSQVFEWGGISDPSGLTSSPMPQNTGRFWTPSNP